jgi:hypothetical protein
MNPWWGKAVFVWSCHGEKLSWTEAVIEGEGVMGRNCLGVKLPCSWAVIKSCIHNFRPSAPGYMVSLAPNTGRRIRNRSFQIIGPSGSGSLEKETGAMRQPGRQWACEDSSMVSESGLTFQNEGMRQDSRLTLPLSLLGWAGHIRYVSGGRHMIRISQGEKEIMSKRGGKNYFGVVWISQVRGMNLPGTGQCVQHVVVNICQD